MCRRSHLAFHLFYCFRSSSAAGSTSLVNPDDGLLLSLLPVLGTNQLKISN
jgi:hypothetical protein